MKNRRLSCSIWVACFFSFSSLISAQVSLTLDNAFIDKYRNKATIVADFIVDKSHDRPNTAAKDGDLHIAGRSPQDIGLPVVAEIMNAKNVSAIVATVKSAAGTEVSHKVSGAWRIWFEHPGDDQKQFEPVPVSENTNPDHMFEIHPVNVVDGDSISETIKLIDGYTPKSAKDAFKHYQGTECHLIANGDGTTTIESLKRTRNYAKFVMEISGGQKVVGDGRFISADVYDLSGNLLVEDIRMVFIKNTAPELKVRSLEDGDRLKVLGIPRVNLNEIQKRMKKSTATHSLLDKPLPYEMIIVGIYN